MWASMKRFFKRKGLRIIFFLVTAIILLLVSFYYILNKYPSLALPDPLFQMEVDSLIGGGIAGVTSVFMVTSSGNVYHRFSPGYGTLPKIEVFKRVPKKEVDELKQALLETNIWNLEENYPQYSGTGWKVTINGRSKSLYFDKTPQELEKAENIFWE